VIPWSATNADRTVTQIGVTDDPRLRDALASPVNGLIAAGVREEARVELTAVALGGAHGRPVPLGIVRDEA
jgi:hypothetical protein